MTDKQLAWEAYKEAWNQQSSTNSMSKLDVRTAKQHFNTWWENNE